MNVSPYLIHLSAGHNRSWQPIYQARHDSFGPLAPGNRSYDEPCPEEPSFNSRRLREGLRILRGKRICVVGDNGWTLNYATAFLYRFLNSNRFAVIAAINDTRQAPVTLQTPYIIFDTLDRAIFAGKLSGAVLLLWKTFGSDHPGTTSSPGVVAHRACIQLNSSPFATGTAGMRGMLEMLIHQMIHAYFLICCGAQKPGDKRDGRLDDGIHFGVILSTINDITSSCTGGGLNMAFHAGERSTSRPAKRGRGKFISLDPEGMSMPLPLCDGKTHCMHDNRHISKAQLVNWQVQDYAKAIGDDWESRGQHVFFWIDGQHQRIDRINGPPSKLYSELIWDGKRFAVPRDRASKFSSLVGLGNDNKYGDMKLPDCSIDAFDCLWRFVTYGAYDMEQYGREHEVSPGPPVLLSPHSRRGMNARIHVQVCKLADALRFTELQKYAVSRLFALPATSDDPVALLKDVYDTAKPLSVALQTWTRKFLAQHENGSGVSNYEKIYDWHRARFTQIFGQFPNLREDCQLVIASLRSGVNLNDANPAAVGGFEHAPNFLDGPGCGKYGMPARALHGCRCL